MSDPALSWEFTASLTGATDSRKDYRPRARERGDRLPRCASSWLGLLTAAIFTRGLARRLAPCGRADHYVMSRVSVRCMRADAGASYLVHSQIPTLRRMA